MSPRVDPTTILPAPRPRRNDPLSRMIAEALDHQLLCCAEKDESFTISDIRDQLLKWPELEGVASDQLRFRVRDRLKTLEKKGLVVEAGFRGKNRRLFRLQLSTPEDASAATPPPSSSSPAQAASSADSARPLLEHLEQERHYLQAAMQAAISEAEHCKHLMASFPAERSHIAPLLEAAIENSSRLQGQWNANLKIRQRLAHRSAPEAPPVQECRS